MSVDIPLLAATYTSDTPDDSITPDIEVARAFDARRAGRDVEMEAVRALIMKKRNSNSH